jgi:hypothetical protein
MCVCGVCDVYVLYGVMCMWGVCVCVCVVCSPNSTFTALRNFSSQNPPYEHDQKTRQRFSSMFNVIIIWGEFKMSSVTRKRFYQVL